MRFLATSIVCRAFGPLVARWIPECCDSAPASCHALQRQVSAVRAVCSNPARTDLCGGREVNSRPYRDCGRGGRATVPPIPIVWLFGEASVPVDAQAPRHQY